MSAQSGLTAVTQLETARDPETEGGDHRLRPQHGFVVAVPVDAVLPRAVAVEQRAVEAVTGDRLDPAAQRGERRRPGMAREASARVAVIGAGIAIPDIEARDRQVPPGDTDLALFPGRRALQLLK